MITIFAIIALLTFALFSFYVTGLEGADEKPWVHFAALFSGGVSIILIVAEVLSRMHH